MMPVMHMMMPVMYGMMLRMWLRHGKTRKTH
jgi:hypothetical protein